MSGFSLRIGSVDIEISKDPKHIAAAKAMGLWTENARAREQACINHLKTIGLGEEIAWTKAPYKIDELCLLNLASVEEFLNHVGELEGFDAESEAEEKSRFKHLPWHMDCIWLPVRLDAPKVPVFEDHGFPVFLGSCQGLLENLNEIRSLSSLGLGQAPRGYDLMRSDLKAFYRSNFAIEDPTAIIQWVWKGLHDGVTLALQHGAPLVGCGC